MTMKTNFVKAKDMEKLALSLEEREIMKEEGNKPPFHPSYGTL
jgi:hypothetical protein